jgi:uncharacterized protein
MALVVHGDFEWHDAKAATNITKHGVSFEEAATAVTDPKAVFLADELDPSRHIAIGASAKGRVLYVVHVEVVHNVRGQRDRIISARPANKAEELIYATP